MRTPSAIKASPLGCCLRDYVKRSGQKGPGEDRVRHQVACLIAVVWWLLLGMVLAAAQPQSIPTEDVRVGHQYFVQYCSACHGVEGRGDGPAASALQPPPADLTRIAQRRGGHFPVADIPAAINGRTVIPAHGSREMPIRGARLGEMAGGGAAGEAVVQAVLRIRIDDLQALQH
jgi:mono/diheme cytochrome c family protein